MVILRATFPSKRRSSTFGFLALDGNLRTAAALCVAVEIFAGITTAGSRTRAMNCPGCQVDPSALYRPGLRCSLVIISSTF